MEIDLSLVPEIEKKERLKWALRLRRRAIAGLLVLYALGCLLGIWPPLLAACALLGFFFVVNELREYLLRFDISLDGTIQTIVAGEIVGVAILIYFTGGYESMLLPFSALQVVGISIHLTFRAGEAMAYLATACLALVNLLEWVGVLPHSPLFLRDAAGGYVYLASYGPMGGAGTMGVLGMPRGFAYLVVATAAYGFLLSLSAYSSGYITNKLKVREMLLDRANRVLGDLYKVSSALLGELTREKVAAIIAQWMVEEAGFARCLVALERQDADPLVTSYPAGSFAPDEPARLLAGLSPPDGPAVFKEGYMSLTLSGAGGALGRVLLASEAALKPEEITVVRTALNHFQTAVEKAAYFEEVLALSIRDGMTGVFNHRHLVETLRVEVRRAARYRQPLALLLVDVDHFKDVNDTHGHLLGDAVLKELARILSACVRESDFVGRYGGEEFLVIAPQSDLKAGAALAERLRARVAGAHWSREGLMVTISIGVAELLADEAHTEDDLIRRADARLYAAKSGGRDRVVAA